MSQANIVDGLFSKTGGYESAILCTYGLNLYFFENYLMKLGALSTCENICIFTDSSTYDSFLQEAYKPKWLNKRYLINRVPAKGVFHPKLYMFASEQKAILSIGSANLTRDGIASNSELLSFFEISKKDQTYSQLLVESISYVKRIAQSIKSQKANDLIKSFDEICSTYVSSIRNDDIRFIHNLDKSLFDSIVEMTQNYDITKVQVISPFYDSKLSVFHKLREAFPDIKVEIFLQQWKTNFPVELLDQIKLSCSLFLYEDLERYLHGKAILLHSKSGIFVFAGSSNFNLCVSSSAKSEQVFPIEYAS